VFIQNCENENFRNKGQGEAPAGECEGRHLVAVRLVEVQRAMTAVQAVMSAMHVAVNALISVSLYVHHIFQHINVY
jgi:hypothetical protein